MAIVEVSGNLGAAPELRYTGKGDPWARLAICENSGRGAAKKVEWWEGIVFGSKAVWYCEVLEKGMAVRVKGRLKVEPFEKDGVARIGRTVLVEMLGFSGGTAKASAETQSAQSTDAENGEEGGLG